MPGIIPCSSIAYTARRPMSNLLAISCTDNRRLPVPGSASLEFTSGLDMAPSQVQYLPLGSDHLQAEWVVAFDAAGFARPTMLTGHTVSDRCEAVFGHCGGLLLPD